MLKILTALALPALLACEDAVVGLLLADSRRAYRWAFGALIVGVGGTLAVLFALGCSHQWYAAWDTASALDRGWRVLNGQRPHLDFYSYLGAVPLLVMGLGMWVVGPSVSALSASYALLLPVVAVWAWALARPRLPAFLALLFAALSGFLLVGTHALGLGGGYKTTSYMGGYNRLCWALFGLLAIQALLPSRRALSWKAANLDGLSTGVVFAVLFFSKVNYFAMALGAVLVGCVLFRETRRGVPGMAAGAAGAALAVLAYLRFDLGAYLGDLTMLTRNYPLGGRLRDLWVTTSMNLTPLALVLTAAVLASKPLCDPGARAQAAGWGRLLLAAAACAGFGAVICSMNAQDRDIPLFGLAALILCEGFRRRQLAGDADAPPRPDARLRYLLCGLIAVYLAGAILAADAASIAYSFAWKLVKAKDMPQAARIHSPSMRGMILPPATNEQGMDHDQIVQAILQDDPQKFTFSPYRYACWVNDGLEVLRRHVTAQSRVFTLDWYNPFSFALRFPPPRGTQIGWHRGYTFDEHNHLPADRVFADVTHVMVPKRPLLRDTLELMRELYGPTLDEHFERIDESRLWTLYARR